VHCTSTPVIAPKSKTYQASQFAEFFCIQASLAAAQYPTIRRLRRGRLLWSLDLSLYWSGCDCFAKLYLKRHQIKETRLNASFFMDV
jgi:hypothetical protein